MRHTSRIPGYPLPPKFIHSAARSSVEDFYNFGASEVTMTGQYYADDSGPNSGPSKNPWLFPSSVPEVHFAVVAAEPVLGSLLEALAQGLEAILLRRVNSLCKASEPLRL